MSNIKKLIMSGAAGGGDPLNVEQVFSTDLWEGTGSPPVINNGIALVDSANGNTGSSTEFSGSASEYLNKSSDLTGNANGKTFTVSFWINPTDDTNTTKYIYHTSGTWKNTISYGTNGAIFVGFFQSAGSGGTVFELQSPDIRLGFGGWNHVIFSADMTDTSKRHLYINDQAASANYTHNNNNIDFTRSQHAIGDDLTTAVSGNLHGYLAHFFLDYTYRDLSVESNRRTFIDSARGSTSVSTLSALNPIIYLPMTSGYSVGENEGTGGDFSAVGSPSIDTTNGTEAVSGVGQGGMVWYRRRDGAENNTVEDTERGPRQQIYTDVSNSTGTASIYGLQAFNSNGYIAGINTNGGEYVGWTFRKAEKFFDIVTYTGDQVVGRTVSHNLGSTPGMIWIKKLDTSEDWSVWHRDFNVNGSGLTTQFLKLNSNSSNTNTGSGASAVEDVRSATSTAFTIGNDNRVNLNNATYVAYLFAHNDGDGGFGPDGDKDIIKCGVYTGNGSNTGPVINLGFEPQWLMIKGLSIAKEWRVFDVMRGMPVGGSGAFIEANSSNAEGTDSGPVALLPNGFQLSQGGSETNNNNDTYIYMVIRRGPMAVPDDVTKVFAVDSSPNSNNPRFISGFPVDMAMQRRRSSSGVDGFDISARLTQGFYLRTGSTNAEATSSTIADFDYQNGFDDDGDGSTNFIAHMWKRAPGYFDVVAYTGTGNAGHTVSHNLGAVPEMMWCKNRDGSGSSWVVYHKDLDGTNAATKYLYLNSTDAVAPYTGHFNDTQPTSSVITLGTGSGAINYSGRKHIIYAFATTAGVSKVGSYTGNSTVGHTIDCGFSNGPKFVLIKRSSHSGADDSWYVFDTERGLASGGDSRLRLNDTSAEYTGIDDIDPHSSGFKLMSLGGSDLNISGSTYIFYAIAA